MPKPNSKKNTLRIYINYRKLNNIIIKNQYLLSNIQKLRNLLNGIK